MKTIFYYLIPASAIEQARQYAHAEGEPNEVFQVRLSVDGSMAVVQACWTDLEAMDALGTRLGKLLPDGQAEEAVYEVLSGPIWQDLPEELGEEAGRRSRKR
jgi:hypothetical protein